MMVDKSQGSFQGRMTRIGAWAVRIKAVQTIRWAERACGRRPLRVCEIGPGRGIVLQTAAARGHACFAVDLDPLALDRARAAGAVAWKARVPPLPGEIDSMDCIVLESVLEHMAGYSEARDLLESCRLALNGGGCIVVRCPEVRYSQWRFWDNAQDHQYVTSVQRVTMLCRECGYEIVRCGCGLDHLTGLPGWLLWQCMRCVPWRAVHRGLYRPWQTSAWSKLGEKVPHCYVVARRPSTPVPGPLTGTLHPPASRECLVEIPGDGICAR